MEIINVDYNQDMSQVELTATEGESRTYDFKAARYLKISAIFNVISLILAAVLFFILYQIIKNLISDLPSEVREAFNFEVARELLTQIPTPLVALIVGSFILFVIVIGCRIAVTVLSFTCKNTNRCSLGILVLAIIIYINTVLAFVISLIDVINPTVFNFADGVMAAGVTPQAIGSLIGASIVMVFDTLLIIGAIRKRRFDKQVHKIL